MIRSDPATAAELSGTPPVPDRPPAIEAAASSASRTSGETRVARTAGGIVHAIGEDARTIPLTRNADVHPARTTGSHARTTGSFGRTTSLGRTTGSFARTTSLARTTGSHARTTGSHARTTGSHARTTGSHARPQANAAGSPQPVLRLALRSRSEIANRGLNILIAGVSLVLLAPLFLLVALAIKLTSPGPVLYTQTRVGLDRRSRRALALYDRRASDVGGSVFTIYKFRSMYLDAERQSGEIWATRNDPRVTAVGRFLRATRIDELPQLWNVLRGEMNIVGPRPERPGIAARLRQDISEYPLRHRAKPGITGLAQINAAYDSTLDDVRLKVRYDLEYLGRQSVAEDVRIMLKTVPVMLFKRGGW